MNGAHLGLETRDWMAARMLTDCAEEYRHIHQTRGLGTRHLDPVV